MGGQRGTARYLTYTTPIRAYRTSNGNDAAVGDVAEIIDLTGSEVGLNKLCLYVSGAVGDELLVWVDDGDGGWYAHSSFDLEYVDELIIVEDVPARQVKIQNLAVAGDVVIKEEHTE